MNVCHQQNERFSCSGDVMVDANIGAWVRELADCFVGINSMDSAASDDVQHLDGYILEKSTAVCAY